jgi:hypothetical protein
VTSLARRGCEQPREYIIGLQQRAAEALTSVYHRLGGAGSSQPATYRRKNTSLEGSAAPFNWCPWPDSNQHDVATT